MIRIYHHPRCRKSRAGLEYLRDTTVDFETIDYIKNGITEEEIREILTKMNTTPSNLVRTQEDYYKKQLKGKDIPGDDWISILAENPRLIKRPIIVTEHKAVLGQPPENIDNLL
ncbi:MAG: arsenate reductase [Bacteroides sp. SM23_62]|jgi:arsenate reductase (glutaredoxin)|nr:MAG: arsenate reductase [Bacteroides sp. SM23_62]